MCLHKRKQQAPGESGWEASTVSDPTEVLKTCCSTLNKRHVLKNIGDVDEEKFELFKATPTGKSLFEKYEVAKGNYKATRRRAKAAASEVNRIKRSVSRPTSLLF